jgi:hypothetical protein
MGTRRRLRLARHRGTTNNVCSLYPAVVQAPLPEAGPMLGIDRTAGGAPLCWDPFEAYEAGLVNNPNTWVMGEPGFGKSSLIKCLLHGVMAIYGQRRWAMIVDPKGEYLPFASSAGLAVVRLTPGGAVRLNPLDGGPCADPSGSEQRSARQTKMLTALAATVLGRDLTPFERKVLRTDVDALRPVYTTGLPPTLPDFVRLLANPTGEVCDELRRDRDTVVSDGEELLFALDELLTGSLRGMFDGPTTVAVDWDGPGLVLDLSGVLSDPQAMPLAMVAGTSWLTELKQVRSGRQRLLVLDEAYYQLANAQTVSFCQETWKLGRSYGIAPIAICHRPSDLGAQADTGTAVAKMAEGLLADSATKIVFRQAPGELTTGAELLGLSDAEAVAISRLGRGEAVWRVGDRSLIARHLVPAGLAEVVNTDQYMHRDSLVDPRQDELRDAGGS